MTRTEIIAALSNWKAIALDDKALTDYLSQGNSFIFQYPSYVSVSDFIHAYPAIHENELYFLMIPSEFDKQAYDSDFDQYVTPCKLISRSSVPESTLITRTGNNRITSIAAQLRTDAWDNNYTTWIPQQLATTHGIFMSFAIPIDSFEATEIQLNLGLRLNATIADLVLITQPEKDLFYYDNFAKPVPPYTVQNPQINFYLSTL